MRPFLPLFLLAITLPSFAVQAAATITPSIFDFHSGFWVNLHHFLYLEALSEHPENARVPLPSRRKTSQSCAHSPRTSARFGRRPSPTTQTT